MVRENCIVQPWIFFNQEVICDNARLRIQHRERLWMILIGHNQRKLPKMVWDPENYWKYWEVLETFENSFILWRTVSIFLETLHISEKYARSIHTPATIWGIQELFEAPKNYLRLPTALLQLQKLFEISKNTQQKHCGGRKETLVFRKIIALLLLNMALSAQYNL